ncbi:chloride channel protein [Marinomonas posidonica]|uniref:chloride channel protein n=1 Tax=Marinomonas posidonica TaxID=936476 RepID=UPI00031F4321|nr:chloride channel protein [Marinomonas posidonica]
MFKLSLLGGLCGLVCGLVMAFFYMVMYVPARYFIEMEFDSFTSLPLITRMTLPVLACFLLALLFHLIPKAYHKVGVPYVVERLTYHGGHLPVWNGLVQFVSAVVGLLGGLSMGKEGPAVHLGATLGSVLAVRTKLTQYGVETMLACGVAGAIAAIFQTPLAGVLFAFEVIFLEYRQRFVLPVLLSSVVATFVSHYLIGPMNAFDIDALHHVTLSLELLAACLLLVVMIVLLVALFFHIQKVTWRFSQVSVWWRFAIVALLTALAAAYLPESLGIGYASLSRLLAGEVFVYALLVLILVKTVLTAVTIGLGIPGGMIGPAFVIGGLAGVFVALVFGVEAGNIALFALLGMAAMMAASFQAPLTALVAIIEMTQSSASIVPALFVIVLSCLLLRVVFHQESIFVERLKFMGMASSISPFRRHLRQHKVSSVSDAALLLPVKIPLEQVKDLASSVVNYVAFEADGCWYWVHRSHVLDALQNLDFGPQPWLGFDQGVGMMDLRLAVASEAILQIDEPSSLEALLDWFQETRQNDVLIRLPNATYCVVSKHHLDHFLLKHDD